MNKLIYKGTGVRFIPGVPARDLSTEEANALPESVVKLCLSSGLYAEEGKEEKVKAAPATDQPKEAING
jgi:hypothetical protein